LSQNRHFSPIILATILNNTGIAAQQVLHEGVRVHGLHHGEGVLVQGRGAALRAGLEVQQQGDNAM
jgi:hypothetical protein